MRLRYLASLLCLTTAAFAQTLTPRQQLDRKAPGWLKLYDVPSVSIAYIEHGRIAWTAVYGEQSPGVPATTETLYNVASLTKPITAEIVLRLAAQGRLSLDEPMAPVWLDPDLLGPDGQPQPWAKLLTPRLALSHQTGFANWRRMTGGKLTMKFEPGTQTSYSGEGYNYVARFAEKKTGEPWEQLAQRLVFDPLGMKSTAYSPRPWFAGRVAEPHGPAGEAAPKPATSWNGADLVETTASDYARFVIGAMNDTALTPELRKQRVTSTRNQVEQADADKLCSANAPELPCHVAAGMGLGWQVFDINGTVVVDHGGNDWGVRTHVFYLPATQTGVVMLTNGENGNKVYREVTRLLYDNPLYVGTL
ncbi:serine hydrolase domain-containing protein [Granulicella rosea]|nr:serine hydrolase domain-containing protein [Granulicella rosea]